MIFPYSPVLGLSGCQLTGLVSHVEREGGYFWVQRELGAAELILIQVNLLHYFTVFIFDDQCAIDQLAVTAMAGAQDLVNYSRKYLNQVRLVNIHNRSSKLI